MSIISTLGAVPSRLYALYAFILQNGPETRDRLEALATPRALRKKDDDEDGGSTAVFDSALREARSVELLEEADGKLRIPEAAKVEPRDAPHSFNAHMTRVLFDQAFAERAGQSAFAPGLAWFLMQNPVEPLQFNQSPKTRIEAQLGEVGGVFELTTPARFQNLAYWARHLGFATIVGARDARWVVPDPAPAIAAALPRIFAEDREMPVGSFLQRLAMIYPVLESGTVRADVEGRATHNATSEERQMSAATSLAIRRLADQGRLTLSAPSDAAPTILRVGDLEERVGYIALGTC